MPIKQNKIKINNFLKIKIKNKKLVVQLKKVALNAFTHDLAIFFVILCFQKKEKFNCCQILNQYHCVLSFIICLHKLLIFYYEIVAHGKNVFVKFPLFVYNHQLFFTFVLSSSPYTNDNDNNVSRGPTSD